MERIEYYYNREKMINYLSKISEKNDIKSTLYFPPGLTTNQIITSINITAPENEIINVIEIINKSGTGGCLFLGNDLTLISPPIPIKDHVVFQGIETSILENIYQSEYIIGVILVRLGSYALAVCNGEKIINSKVGTGLVHSRHRQGGSSSQRFRRHREKQIETFLKRICVYIKEHLEPEIVTMDYAIFGGAKSTIQLLEKECPLLQKLEGRLLPPLLDIPEPRQYVLESVIKRIWTSHVIEIREEVP
jgi:hypothetical protein